MPQSFEKKSGTGVPRREFNTAMAGAGAMLAMSGHLNARSGGKEVRTFFVNLSHEDHEGHTYHLVVGKNRYELQRATGSHPALVKARRTHTVLQRLPPNAITHVVENAVMPADAVQASYLMKDPDTTAGTWGMSAVFVLPPKQSFTYAYNRARQKAGASAALPLSAKRRKYGLPAATSLQELLDEQDVLDTTDWATALVNLHPEMLSAEPNSCAHIQTNHIQAYPATDDLSDALGCAGTALPQGQTGTNPCDSSARRPRATASDNPTGWATLVPYTDTDGTTPLKSDRGNTKGLILYDAKWQPDIAVPWVSSAMQVASKSAKNDTTLGADATNRVPTNPPAQELAGTIWYTHDGTASIDQTPGKSQRVGGSDNASFTITNITPNFNGYSLDKTISISGGNVNVTLTFKNWYLRWLGLYIVFYKGGTVVDKSQLPGISQVPSFDTANNELFLGTLTPEFTIFGIPVQASGNTVNFVFPTGVADKASILASGLGLGSSTFQDTETVGIVMTSCFNLSLPMLLIAFGLGAQVDACVKTVIIPSVVALVTEVINSAEGGTPAQFIAIFWRSIVRGILNPTGPLLAFLTALGEFFTEWEIFDSFVDAIPLVGAILQAIGALGALAEVTETACEVVLSPKTYQYDLVGTHDLSVTINPDPKDTEFPATAATYIVTAIFDNGTPNVQTLNMPGTGVKTLPAVVFSAVPLGGNVIVSVAFYATDGTQVGHGSSGSVPNVVGATVTITITEDQLPITTSTVYKHKQKTILDSQGNHVWSCNASMPGVPTSQSACQPNPGNICAYRNITVNSQGLVGYGWQSYNTSGCVPKGASGQLDQMAMIPNVNGSNNNAQGGYAATPCSLGGAAKLVYDPLGRSGLNYYLDTSQSVNVLRQVTLSPPGFDDPTANRAWGKFNLSPTDVLLHPAGAIVTINSENSRMESLKIQSQSSSDDEAILASLHGGEGSRPGLFKAPTVSAITSDGVVLILEAGNNRIHALDVAANPVRHFSKQPQPYFFNFSVTGGSGTQYLDMAVEFSGFIYVLSYSNGVYRLDIYHHDQPGAGPISTTMGFNAAKVTVDYWRNVYSLNYEMLMKPDGTLPAVTEPTISQWTPIAPPPCQSQSLRAFLQPDRRRLLRRRNFWKGIPA